MLTIAMLMATTIGIESTDQCALLNIFRGNKPSRQKNVPKAGGGARGMGINPFPGGAVESAGGPGGSGVIPRSNFNISTPRFTPTYRNPTQFMVSNPSRRPLGITRNFNISPRPASVINNPDSNTPPASENPSPDTKPENSADNKPGQKKTQPMPGSETPPATPTIDKQQS
jgi:hypothetical protein